MLVDPLLPATGRAVGYLRVSTAEQTDGGGLDVQRAQIEQLAASRHLEVIAWESDEGVSGAIQDRIGLAGALEVLATGEARWLLVAKIDRLSRDLMVQEKILSDVWRHGGDVVSAAEGENAWLVPDDDTDPSRGFIRKLLGLVAEYERQMIVARMKAGRRRVIAKGGRGGGPVPYGWRCGAHGLEPVTEEQERLDRMAAERDAGRSLPWIAQWANSHGWPARGGGGWTHSSVRRALLSRGRERERLRL